MDIITPGLFVNAMKQSEVNRILEFQEFQYLWNKDYAMIKGIVKSHFKDVPFSEDTLKKYFYLYRDEIQKIVNRKCAGIYDNEPLRELITGETKTKPTVDEEGKKIDGKTENIVDENLPEVLAQCRYHRKVKDAYKMSKFFNTVILHPVWRENRLQIDILTGAMCAVTTTDDFLKIKEIKIARTDAQGLAYNTYWDEDKHYAEYVDGKPKEIKDNPKGINPYKEIARRLGISSMPFAVLRAEEGMYFWGEPNWALFTHQVESIMTLSDNVRGEFLQKFPPLVNTDGESLPAQQKVDPGVVINLKTDSRSDKQATLNYLTPGTDWQNIRENADHRRRSLLNSEGIPEASATTDNSAPKQVGSKTIDEIELHESREEDKGDLYDFEIEFLNVVRMVNNYSQPSTDMKLDEGSKSYFEVTFVEEQPGETAQEKKTRREMEKQFNISSDIDFIMEDKEVDREEAERILKENKSLNKIQTSFAESFLTDFKGNGAN